ncbi:MAG: hypothetical protein HY431_01045 [Candidatus Levybacteria bacterium]|nr:hypothetical protein [Candidatus Levybacteria bacterium]
MARHTSINFLRGREKRFFEKFITWAFTVGRILVIFTETIALTAFLYRFSLDYRIIDLRGEIKAKQTIVSLLKKNEEQFRNLQARIAYAKQIDSEKNVIPETIADVVKTATGKLSFNSLTVSQTSIKIDATARGVTNLTNFLNELREYPTIDTVSLDKIENKTSLATIGVSITATFKKAKPVNEN